MAKKVLSKEEIQKLATQGAAQGLAPEAMKRLAAAKEQKEKLAKELMDQMTGLKKKAEPFKKAILKHYKDSVVGITVLPPKPKKEGEKAEPELLVLLNIEEEDINKLVKKKKEITDKLESLRSDAIKKVNVNYLALKEVWDACEKGKYEILGLITMGLPIHDNGWITAIRSVEMHKSQVIQKFEKYVICYVMAGSVLRGEAKAESDLDTFVVIDDTDVTRMTAAELKSKLTSIIWGMAAQASLASGGKYKIHTQIYLLTDMWKSINLAHPVIFTFIREGIPLYDRGMFMPWKMLLRKGMIKSTPEAIQGYIKSGKQAIERVKKKLRSIAVEDLFYASSIPAQGALMLVGREPPVPWHTPKEFNEHFVKNRKLMTAKDTEILMKNLKTYKGFEHGELKDIDPKEVISNLEATEKFLKKIEKMFDKLQEEQVASEVEEVYTRAVDDIKAALRLLNVKSGSLHSDLKSKIVDAGYAPKRFITIFKDIEDANKTHKISREKIANLLFEEEKLACEMFDRIRAERGGKIEKFKISVGYGKGKIAGIWMLNDDAYIVMDANDPKNKIKKYKIAKDGSLADGKSTSLDAINKVLKQFSGKPSSLTDEGMASIKKILGKDAKILIGA